MDKWIYEKENVLTAELCENIITRFENDKLRQHPGGTAGGVVKNIKDTIDLKISVYNEWRDIDILINEVLYIHFELYIEQLKAIKDNKSLMFTFPKKVGDMGYQIQKYKKNEGKYTWHTDNLISNNYRQRLITFLFYLNDIDKGGETDFHYKKIIPRAGKLIFFPATWTFPHCGNIPESSDKYIITGWIHEN